MVRVDSAIRNTVESYVKKSLDGEDFSSPRIRIFSKRKWKVVVIVDRSLNTHCNELRVKKQVSFGKIFHFYLSWHIWLFECRNCAYLWFFDQNWDTSCRSYCVQCLRRLFLRSWAVLEQLRRDLKWYLHTMPIVELQHRKRYLLIQAFILKCIWLYWLLVKLRLDVNVTEIRGNCWRTLCLMLYHTCLKLNVNHTRHMGVSQL